MIRARTRLSLLKTLPIFIFLLIFISSGAAADFPASDSNPEIFWLQPFTGDNSNMPQHYSSGSSITMAAEVKSAFHENADGIDFYRKKAADTAWTNIDSQNIQTQWTHRTESADNDYPAWTYFPEKTSDEVTLNEGDSTTVICSGTEVSIAANSITDSTPGETTLEIAGTTYNLYEGEYVDPAYCTPLRVEEIGSFPYVDVRRYEDFVAPNDGNYRYKTVVEDTNGDFYHSQSIYFDVSGSDGNNVPYINEVRVSNETSYDFLPASNIQEGAVVAAEVKQQEDDKFNITLVDRNSNTELQERQYDPFEDAFIEDTIYSSLLDTTLGNFIDVGPYQFGSGDTAVFKLSAEEYEQTDFLKSNGTTYSLGFNIQDFDTSTDRNSLDYSVPVEQANDAPTIDSISYQQDYLNSSIDQFSGLSGGDSIDALVVEVSDPDNTGDHVVKVNLTQEYDGIEHVKESTFSKPSFVDGNKYYFSHSNFSQQVNTRYEAADSLDFKDNVVDSGTWTASAEVSDGINTVNDSVSVQIPWGNLQVERTRPSTTPLSILDNETFLNSNRIFCGGGPECVNQNESLSLYWDPKPVDNLLGGLS